MELKAGFKQTDVGEIPDDWEVIELKDLSEKIMVGIASSATHAYRDNGVVLFRNQNIKPNYLDDTDILFIRPEYESLFKNKRLKTDDLLTARTGYPGTTCKVPSKYEGAQSFTTLITRIKNDSIDINFLSYYLNSEKGKLFFELNQIGGGQKNVNAGTLKFMPIPLPPTKAEQTAIATALGDMDNLINGLAQLIEKKKSIKEGAMQELLRPKEGWVVKKLGEVFEITAGGDLNKNKFSLFQDETYLYPVYSNALTNKGLYGYTSEFNHLNDTITVTARGEVGNANARNTKYSAIGRVIVLNPILEINCFFISECINNLIEFANESTGVPQLTAPQISKYEIPFPSIEEQTDISNILLDMDIEILSLENNLSKYKLIKQGMMQELLTGKIRLV